jgi:cyclopropane fatty-acyl-phospholipid synthase-like methyltransferase
MDYKMKQYSPACERNRDPILQCLQSTLSDSVQHVLEIGSGTGQHAVYFARSLDQLMWHTADLPHNHDSIVSWIDESKLSNVLPPLSFDINHPPKIDITLDAVFTANTCHIMSLEEVRKMFVWVGSKLPEGGLFIVYGPFQYQGVHTAESNVQFDHSLQEQKATQGIRDIDDIKRFSPELILKADIEMPANNRILVFNKL